MGNKQKQTKFVPLPQDDLAAALALENSIRLDL